MNATTDKKSSQYVNDQIKGHSTDTRRARPAYRNEDGTYQIAEGTDLSWGYHLYYSGAQIRHVDDLDGQEPWAEIYSIGTGRDQELVAVSKE